MSEGNREESSLRDRYLMLLLGISVSRALLVICFTEELAVQVLMICRGLHSRDLFAIAHKCPAP